MYSYAVGVYAVVLSLIISGVVYNMPKRHVAMKKPAINTDDGDRRNPLLSAEDEEPFNRLDDADANVMWCTAEDSENVPTALVSESEASTKWSTSESELVMAAWALNFPASETDVTIWRLPSAVVEGDLNDVVAESTSKDIKERMDQMRCEGFLSAFNVLYHRIHLLCFQVQVSCSICRGRGMHV